MNIKKIIIIPLLLLACLQAAAQHWPDVTRLEEGEREVRAVWYCTLGGMDWPGRQYAQTEAKAERQRELLRRDFDQLQAAGINVILFQCRTRGMVAYESAYETWDPAFSGTPGVSPLYDPLAFAIDEAHRRGMELHAYLVTYPLCTVQQARQLGKKALPNAHPELCQNCDGRWYMDPGAPGTPDYLAKMCREIAENYDVDGIHLDYIRYPEKEVKFNDNIAYRKYGKGQNKAQWKRDRVTAAVRAVHDAVRAVRPWCKLSCSPVGKYSDLPRASSRGWNCRDAVSQDAQLWLHENWMDWLLPMMYFDGQNFYPFALNWQQESAGHPVAPGLGIYFLDPRERGWSSTVITRELNFLRQIRSGGQAYFRTRFLLDNHKGIYDFVSDFNRQPALTPASTWLDATPPAAPVVTAKRLDSFVTRLSWDAVADETPVTYNVYRVDGDGRRILVAHHLQATTYDYAPANPRSLSDALFVCTMDAYGNESEPAAVPAYRPIDVPVIK